MEDTNGRFADGACIVPGGDHVVHGDRDGDGSGVGRPPQGGWMWGDPEDGIPPDAPLSLLLLGASRVMGAFYGTTVAHAGVAAELKSQLNCVLACSPEGARSADNLALRRRP